MNAPRAMFAAGALAIALSGCGSSKTKDVSSAASTPAPTTAATTATTAKPAAGAAALKHKPRITPPTGPPPKRLVVRDLVKGTGPAARPGANVSVQYVGVLYANGKQFDASWDRGQPFQFKLGAQMVIPGWDRGVAGMKVGGRRELIIPSALGYGAQGTPDGSIPPNSALIFDIDLLRVS